MAAQAVGPARPRVLQVTARYLPFMGGVETHVHEISHRLRSRGFDVTILTTDPGGRLPAREMVRGVPVRRMRAWPAQRDYYLAPGIVQTVARGGWDLVHCQGVHTLVAPLAMLAARLSRVPYVLTFHSGGHPSRLRNAVRGAQWLALRPLLRSAAQLIAVSDFERDLFSRAVGGAAQIRVIRNGCEPLATPRLAMPEAGGARVVSVGRLERYKGHHRVIEALPHLLQRRPDATLLILGAGPYEAALRALARELGIESRVEIRAIPPEHRAEMAAELGRAAVVALLSDYEAHPIAVMEALALGLPVLVADTSGLSELATSGQARAVPLECPPSTVADALLDQIERPLVPSLAALPTWDDCVDQLAAVYRSVLGARSELLCAS
ncbi:MAG: glycosyltransferase family 4 protein [Chloroflexota bacterium]